MNRKLFKLKALRKHVDVRGSLFEILRFKDEDIPGNGYLYCFTINPGQVRGGHYHKKKHEWFSCVSGSSIAIVEHNDGTKEKIILEDSNPSVIYNGPYTVHTFYNETNKPAVIISYGSKQHDPADPDTYQS